MTMAEATMRFPWGAKARARRREAAGRRWQQQQTEEAFARIHALARGARWQEEKTRALPIITQAPLMTRLQASRSQPRR
jgi:hypothetical protein